MASGCAPQTNVQKKVCKAFELIKVLEKHWLKPDVLYSMNGYPAKRADFRFHHTQPIFTDGSAKNVQWPEIAVASSACFQIGNDSLHRVIAAQLPLSSRYRWFIMSFVLLL